MYDRVLVPTDGSDHALRGEPAEKILAYADDHEVDLVAMGTHGRTGSTGIPPGA